MDVSPPTWLITVLGAAAAALVKTVFDAWIAPHLGPTARLRKAEKAQKAEDQAKASAPPVSRRTGPTVLALDLQLLSKEEELRHLRQELGGAQEACRSLRRELVDSKMVCAQERAMKEELLVQVEQLGRLRVSRDRAAFELSNLTGQLAAERENNLRLNAENARLRTEGGDSPAPLPPRPARVLTKHSVDPQFAVERVRGTTKPEMPATRGAPRKPTNVGP